MEEKVWPAKRIILILKKNPLNALGKKCKLQTLFTMKIILRIYLTVA